MTTPETTTPEPAVRTPAPWSMLQAILAFTVGVVLLLVVSAITQPWVKPVGPSGEQPFSNIVIGLSTIWAIFLGTPLVLTFTVGTKNLRRDFGLFADLPRDAVRGIAWGAGWQLVIVPLLYLPLKLVSASEYDKLSDPAETLRAAATGWHFVLFVLSVSFLAPVFEELFFRGFVLRTFGPRVGKWPAIVIVGVLFGVIHGELLQLPALMAFGAFLAWLSWRNGRLGENIFAHAAFNSVTVVLLAFS